MKIPQFKNMSGPTCLVISSFIRIVLTCFVPVELYTVFYGPKTLAKKLVNTTWPKIWSTIWPQIWSPPSQQIIVEGKFPMHYLIVYTQ